MSVCDKLFHDKKKYQKHLSNCTNMDEEETYFYTFYVCRSSRDYF